ncbi:cupin domain-containing protein [Phenylobacterium deserti]|nr:cupin domain-containing protein [Phenylobacterium deserti]
MAPNAVARLFGWSTLNGALAEHRLVPPRLRLERAGADISKAAFKSRRTRRGAVLQDLDPAALNEALRDGATLIVDAANELNAPLQRICADLSAEFACACQANLYACWGTTQGFDIHWDDHDVFVLQVEGRKRWLLYGSTLEAPTRRGGQFDQHRPEAPLQEIILEPGDVLYLPRGYWHAAVGLGGPTMHLTVGLTRKSGADFLHWLADRALTEPLARRDLPFEQDDEALGERLASLLAQVAAEDPEELARAYRRHVEATQPQRPKLSFPFIGDETELPDRARIRLADGAARVLDRGASVVLTWRGVEFTVSRDLKPALDELAAGEAISIAALEATSPPAARPHLTAFVQEMLRRGAFLIEQEQQ